MSRLCEVYFLAGAPEFTAADRANCPTLAPWLKFVCKRCIRRFGIKYQVSEARAAAKTARRAAGG